MKMSSRIAAVVAVSVCWWMAQAQAAPKIQFDKTTYDFGTTSAVSSVTGKFAFKNVGDAELTVGKPAPSCGCTVAGVKPEKLQPGESGELTFTVNLGSARGPIQKHIAVPSNDPANARMELAIRVDVVQAFEVTPQAVALGDIRVGSSTNLVVNVKRLDGRLLAITNVGVQGKRLEAKAEKIDDKSARIHITAKMDQNFGSFNEQVQVYTDNSPQPAFAISVFGREVGDVTVMPERVYWGIPVLARLPASRMETVLTRNLRVMGTVPGQPLELKSVTSDIKDLNLQVVTIEPSKTYQIVVKLPELPKESVNGNITVETNLASVPKLEVPVQIKVFGR